MKTLFSRIALACLLSSMTVAIAGAQDKDKFKVLKVEPKYHYAYRHFLPDGNENMTENWDGSINWDTHPKRDELWIQTDNKTLLITDKAVLDKFDAAFKPLWDFNLRRPEFMNGYYEARGEQRGLQHSARNIDRQIANLQRQSDRARSDDERNEIKNRISDLQKEKDSMSSQQDAAAKKLDQETKKREEFYRQREVIRAKVYSQTDKLIDEALAKGLAQPGNP